MIRNSLVVKYYALAILFLLVFLVLGFVTQDFLIRTFSDFELKRPKFEPPSYVAKLIDRLDPDKVKAVTEYTHILGNEFGPAVKLFDKAGVQVFPIEIKSEILNANLLQELKQPYDHVVQAEDWARGEPGFARALHFGPHPGPGPRPHDGPPLSGSSLGPPPEPPPGPGPGFSYSIVRLSGSTPYFLKILPPFGKDFPRPNKWFFILPLVSLFGSLILGVGVTIFIVYSAIVKHTKTADQVISQLQQGNLKARFQIRKDDEVGRAMLKFNQMADEIEALVQRLRDVETSRIRLMQDLAHDLRTPIASLKSLIETLKFRDQELTADVKSELLHLSAKEIDYFQRLVEDLLLLAQVAEPKYKVGADLIDIVPILNEEIYDCELKSKSAANVVQIEKKISEDAIKMIGDPYLLKRLIRNGLENSISFANRKVLVSCLQIDGQIKIVIEDDGKGFSDEALQKFGERRISRIIEAERSKRVSVGLGSVIMKTICELHRGSIKASNLVTAEGKVSGAKVEIFLS